jgi:hypothetical protein
VALHLPWSIDFLAPGGTLESFTGGTPSDHPSDLPALLRFEVGPLGSAPFGWCFLIAAALPLLIGRAERHTWAVRGWTVAIGSFATAWVAQTGVLGIALPPLDLLLVPAAAGIALATAMGVAAFEIDLPGYRFGWRQIASGLAAAAVVVGVLPVLGGTFDGSWSMPDGDTSRALSFIDEENDEQPFRVLWLGDPTALPLDSWAIDDDLAYATTDEGSPTLENLWIGSDGEPSDLIVDALDLARDGETARLGRLLAPMAIRYIVVTERLAPDPFSDVEIPAPAGLTATLAGQLDLEPLDVPAGLTVFRNQTALPLRSQLPSSVELPTDSAPAGVLGVDLSEATAVLPDDDGRLRWSGEAAEDQTLMLAAAASDGWQLDVDGAEPSRTEPFGWATGFSVEGGGDATLRFHTPLVRYAAIAVEILVWLWVVRRLLRSRFERYPDGPDSVRGGALEPAPADAAPIAAHEVPV